VFTDASLDGVGACYENKVYKWQINGRGTNIAYWEAVTVLLALRTWAEDFKHKTVKIYCDNIAAVAIFQTHRGSDLNLQPIA
jgi:hypothetical protein